MGNLVEYKETFHAFFRPEKSVGDDTKDTVTFINIPLVSIFKLATSLTESEFILSELNDMLEEKDEKLFRTETVRSMLFDGFSVQAFIDLLSDPLVELAVGHVEPPKTFSGGKFAFYKGKNGSASDEYLIRTGKAAYEEFGEIVKWKNLTKLPWWSNPDCQHIRGTDGTLFPPYVNRNSKSETFVPELCRVISLQFYENRVFHGMPVVRFSTSKDDFLAPLRHKPNDCYCAVKDLRLCNRTGVFSLAPCRDGAPISASLPHFLDADQQFIDDLDGLDPQDDLHRSYFDIEPISGVLVAAAKRLQFNVEVEWHPSIPMVSKVRCLTIPIFWAEEVTAIPEKLSKQVLKFYYTQGKIETARWSLVGASIVCILLGLIWVISSKRDELQTAEQWKE